MSSFQATMTVSCTASKFASFSHSVSLPWGERVAVVPLSLSRALVFLFVRLLSFFALLCCLCLPAYLWYCVCVTATLSARRMFAFVLLLGGFLGGAAAIDHDIYTANWPDCIIDRNVEVLKYDQVIECVGVPATRAFLLSVTSCKSDWLNVFAVDTTNYRAWSSGNTFSCICNKICFLSGSGSPNPKSGSCTMPFSGDLYLVVVNKNPISSANITSDLLSAMVRSYFACG